MLSPTWRVRGGVSQHQKTLLSRAAAVAAVREDVEDEEILDLRSACGCMFLSAIGSRGNEPTDVDIAAGLGQARQ